MKITILGAGVAASQLPGIRNRNMPAIVVEFGDNTLLFDCGEGTRFKLEEAGFQYAEIRHVAITHVHADHCVFTPFYQSVFVNKHWQGLPSGNMYIYAPSQVIDSILPSIKSQIPELNHPQIPPYPTLHTKAMKNGDFVSIGNGKLITESVYHGFGLCDAVAFRLETPEGTFVYSGDSGECEGIRKI
jgi:ribonuclease BN (tRNA processing enzyme)